MKKFLICALEPSCIYEPLLSWPEKHLGAIIDYYGTVGCDERIKAAVGRHQPDVTVYSGTLGPHQPKMETLSWIKHNCHRSVFVGWDAGCPDWQPTLRLFRQQKTFDLVVSADGSPHACVDVAFPEPKSPDCWSANKAIKQGVWESEVRDVNLGFMGGISGFHPRVRLFSALGDACTKVVRQPYIPPYAEYVRFVKRCWSTVNSCWTGGMGRHVKGRCIEATLGGSALFEAKGSPLEAYFEPDMDYFSFDEERPQEIFDVLKRQDFHAECTKRAARMLDKVTRLYGPEKFWAAVAGE